VVLAKRLRPQIRLAGGGGGDVSRMGGADNDLISH
jgi:hypothetical protein